MPDGPMLYLDRELPADMMAVLGPRANLTGPGEDALTRADGVIAGASRWDGPRMDAGPRLRVISRSGIGYDSVDVAAATARGIAVCIAPTAPTVSTAEHAVALLMAAAKDVGGNQARLRDASGDYFAQSGSVELAGGTLGLVGYGRIARRVGRVAEALDMRVIAYDPFLDASVADGAELVSFDELLAQADAISVHAPLTDSTRRLFDADAFARMRQGVIFVNSARGALVDQEALLDAVDAGQVGAAALDVTEPEPLPPDHPLLHHPRIVVTPHIASATSAGRLRLYEHAIENALGVLAGAVGSETAVVVNPEVFRPVRRTIGLGVIGFGWMGQAHSRSYLRLPTLFADRTYQPRLAICADNVAARREQATESFGFAAATEDWREVIDSDEVDVVVVTAPNMLHEELCVAASAAGKHVFCEKPVGGTPAQTVRIAAAARAAGIITGVGYNYRWAPMVLHTRQLLETDRLGQLTNYRGRFFSMYGSDPMGLLSWRFLEAEGGYGVSSDILSHAVDLATFLVGPIAKVVGTKETFIRQRPLPQPGAQGHYAVGRPGDPTGEVTNEDFAAALVVFANGVRGTFESSRSIVGPESQMAFELYGTKGAVSWNLEQLNELQVYLADDEGRAPRGYTTVFGGDRYPYHGAFVPGDANSIGFEDLVAIEDHEFLSSIVAGEQHHPGFEEALDYVSFQDAWLRSCDSGTWEDVVRL